MYGSGVLDVTVIIGPGLECQRILQNRSSYDQQHNIHGLWTWNGNEERPTIRASILVSADGPDRCHSFVIDGLIKFEADSKHILSGQTVPLPELNW